MSRKMKNSGNEWIGRIPEEWDARPIKNSFFIVSGATPKSDNADYWDGDVVWVTPADYKFEDKYVTVGKRNLSKAGYESCGTTLVPAGSIIFSKRAPIGTVAIAGRELCTNQGCLSCVPKERVSSKFFYYTMAVFAEQFNLYGTGTTFKEISFSSFSDFKLPLPPFEEQEVIAAYLESKCDEIDAVITDTKRTIEEYKELRKALITKAITKGVRNNRQMKNSGSVWFGEIPAEWRMVRLKYMFHIKKDIAGKEGYTVLSITQRGITPKNIESNEGQLAADYSKYQLVERGDFAMNHMDLLTGWVDISKYDGVTSPDYRVFVLDDEASNKEYYLYMMQMCYFNRIFYGLGQGVSGMGRWRLQADKFLNFYIAVPPAEEQDEIVEALKKQLSEMDALIAAKEQLLTEMEAYKKSVIYEYVTGKKEVPACQ